MERNPVAGWVVSAFDLERVRLPLWFPRRARTSESLEEIYAKGFALLFYDTGEQPYLTGTRRRCFQSEEDGNPIEGVSLLIDDATGSGVLSVWRQLPSGSDPMALRRSAWDASGVDLAQYSHHLNIKTSATERQYPFLALRYEVDDIVDFSNREALDVGRLFTGGYEDEEERYYESYAGSNLSRRRHERLFLRWTDALALYDEHDDWQLRAACFLQLFEHLILWRRALNTCLVKGQRRFESLTLSRPWSLLTANSASTSFHELQLRLGTAPAQSVDSKRLLDVGKENFGLTDLLTAAASRFEMLERRLQWVKAQWLGVLGGLAFVVNIAIQLRLIGRP